MCFLILELMETDQVNVALPKIMIVDDDAIIRAGLRYAIKTTQKFELVGEAPDGEVFLEMLKTRNPEYVILDLMMPGPDGTEVARAALDIKPELKIIIYSSLIEKQTLVNLLDQGIFGYILKTEGFNEMIKALQKIANHQPYFSSELIGEVLKNQLSHKNSNHFSARELEVLEWICKGLSIHEIAAHLFLSPKTIAKHRSNMLRKAKVKSSLELILWGLKSGLVSIRKISYRSGYQKEWSLTNDYYQDTP